MKKTNKKGFTIVELVIVIAVIAILASVLIPVFSNVVEKAKESNAMQEARNAYTEWLYSGDPMNATTIGDDTNFYIASGAYWFEVKEGSFESATIKTAPTGEGVTIKTIAQLTAAE